MKEPAFRKSPPLWFEHIAWQKHQLLGGVRTLVNVLDIRQTYDKALKVSCIFVDDSSAKSV